MCSDFEDKDENNLTVGVLLLFFILHPSSFILHPSSFRLHPSSFKKSPKLSIRRYNSRHTHASVAA